MIKNINRSVIFLLLFCINTFGQINPDSLSISYYPSGKKLEETGFYLNKKLYYKIYYEDGTIKEEKKFDDKTGKKVEEWYSISKETSYTTIIEYWKNENPKEESLIESDGTVIIHKQFTRGGKLKRKAVLIEKEKQIRLINTYNKRGEIKKTYYSVPENFELQPPLHDT